MAFNRKPTSPHKYHQGYYKPMNPEKYTGDPTKIVYRSRWELKFMQYMDLHPQIRKWNSEGVTIVYRDMEGRPHRYYPDFYYEIVDPADESKLERVVVEVKPSKETEKPVKPLNETKKAMRNYYYAAQTYMKNMLKWEAAKNFCAKHKMKFIIVTEKHLEKAKIL